MNDLTKYGGVTYKIKPPVASAAMYITINDTELPDGSLRPIEIFINTKDQSHHQWIVALTRVISALFRKPGPFLFIIEELEQVFDPIGGYFDGGKMIPSIVAHVGKVLREHCTELGLIEEPELVKQNKDLINMKVAEAKELGVKMVMCPECKEKAMLMLSGCMSCNKLLKRIRSNFNVR